MLQRTTSAAGVTYYASPLLAAAGVPHGFSTRIGGVSAAPFDSLNLGNPNGCDVRDDDAHLRENYHRLRSAVGAPARPIDRVHQVHGAAVIVIEPGRQHDPALKADALATADASRLVSVRVADCVPVLLATRDGRAVAAAHAGWRGVIAGVVPVALAALLRLRPGAAAADVVAAVGPCIGPDNFEVGPEVLAEFDRAFGGADDAAAPVRRRPDGKGTIDLKAAIAIQLAAAGVSAERIDVTDRCTVRDADEFYSHRRDRGVTGRMAAVIGPKS